MNLSNYITCTSQWGESLRSFLYLTHDSIHSIQIPQRCNQITSRKWHSFSIIKTPRPPLHLSTNKKNTGPSGPFQDSAPSEPTAELPLHLNKKGNVACQCVSIFPKKISQKHDKAQSTNTMFWIQKNKQKVIFYNFEMMLERSNPPELTCFNECMTAKIQVTNSRDCMSSAFHKPHGVVDSDMVRPWKRTISRSTPGQDDNPWSIPKWFHDDFMMILYPKMKHFR